MYLPRVLAQACLNFEYYFGLPHGSSDQALIERHALGVSGWSTCVLRSYEEIDRERESREELERYQQSHPVGASTARWPVGSVAPMLRSARTLAA